MNTVFLKNVEGVTFTQQSTCPCCQSSISQIHYDKVVLGVSESFTLSECNICHYHSCNEYGCQYCENTQVLKSCSISSKADFIAYLSVLDLDLAFIAGWYEVTGDLDHEDVSMKLATAEDLMKIGRYKSKNIDLIYQSIVKKANELFKK